MKLYHHASLTFRPQGEAKLENAMPRRHKPRPLLLTFILIFSALVAFFVPTPGLRGLNVVKQTVGAFPGPAGQIAIIGNSVVRHVSKCDADQRTIPSMISDLTGRRVLDLSEGGQSMAETLNYAGLALRIPNVSSVVLLLSPSGFGDVDVLDLRALLFFRLVSEPLAANGILSRFQRAREAPSVWLAGREFGQNYAYTYKGVPYPAYDEIKTRYFEPEQRAMGCPESAGRDKRFIESLYWNDYVRIPRQRVDLDDVSRLARAARKAAKNFLIVIMPVAFDDVRDMNPERDKPPNVARRPSLDDTAKNHMEASYRAELQSLQSVDDLVGAVVDELQGTGKLDNTVFIYTSDNGYENGDHRLVGKNSVYEGSIKVPLVMKGPGIPKNETRSELVNNLDVVASIEEIAGVTPGIVADGRSLIPVLLDGRAPWRSAILVEGGAKRYSAVRTATRKYVHYVDGFEELYDLVTDPYELENKAHDPSYAGDIATLRGIHDKLKSCAGAGCWIPFHRTRTSARRSRTALEIGFSS